MVCPCCVPQDPCCGIPENCTLSLTVGDLTFVYNHANGLWENTDDPSITWLVSFGDCRNETAGTGDSKYSACCLSTEAADTPFLGECNEWVRSHFVRLKCTQCCDTDPVTAIGCSLEDPVTYTRVNGADIEAGQESPCDAFIPNLQFTLTCEGEECNEFP
jgi:hypothetical protein